MFTQMISRRSKKYKITKILKDSLIEKGIAVDTLDIEKLVCKVWMSKRQERGMRLTDSGMVLFGQAELQHYDYPIGNLKDYPLNKFRLDVSKYIDCPYYFWQKQGPKSSEAYIRVYDHKVATILSLYGDLEQFLRVKENKIQ